MNATVQTIASGPSCRREEPRGICVQDRYKHNSTNCRIRGDDVDVCQGQNGMKTGIGQTKSHKMSYSNQVFICFKSPELSGIYC